VYASNSTAVTLPEPPFDTPLVPIVSE
jgi:hypothetical protein